MVITAVSVIVKTPARIPLADAWFIFTLKKISAAVPALSGEPRNGSQLIKSAPLSSAP